MSAPRTSSGKRLLRHKRVRKTVRGTGERPRLAVFRSLNHVYAQVIDDLQGVTLAAASSVEKEIKSQIDGKPKVDACKVVGSMIAKRARDKGIKLVVFDRGGHKYHGRVKALAEAARKEGLSF
jgi:large subunit ribosomal protein L18